MERPHQTQHHHRRHRGRLPGNKNRQEPGKVAHEPTEGTSRKSDHGSALAPTSYLDAWLATQVPATVCAIQPGRAPETRPGKKQPRHFERWHSHDSSIITAAKPHHGDSQVATRVQDAPQIHAEHHVVATHISNSRRRKANSDIEAEQENQPQEETTRYEKGARHKTRKDKYEQKRGGAGRGKAVRDDAPKSNKSKSRDKRMKTNSALVTAADLMDKFSSHAIHHDRLTVKPSIQPGIFGNSKVGKAPGDLAFSEMTFLKEGRPPDALKTVPRYRTSDQRTNQDIEDIQVFFSSRKSGVGKPERTGTKGRSQGQRESCQGLSSPVVDLLNQRGSLKATEYSTPSTCNSWAGSSLSPTALNDHRDDDKSCQRPEAASEARVVKSSDTRSAPRYSSAPVGRSSTPELIRQSLVKTGVYRTLSTPKQSALEPAMNAFAEPLEDRIGEHEESRRHAVNVVPKRALDGCNLPSQPSDMRREHGMIQVAERPPQPPEKPRPLSARASIMQQGSPTLVDDAPYHPSEKSMGHGTVPSTLTGTSHVSAMNNDHRRHAAMAPPPRPLSRFRYAMPVRRPQSTLAKAAVQSAFARPSSAMEARPRLPNTSTPQLYEASESQFDPSQPSRLLNHRWLPQVCVREGVMYPPRSIEHQSVDTYTEDIAPEWARSEHENQPPIWDLNNGGHFEPYTKPFFRHDSATGHVPSFNMGATERHPGSQVFPGNTVLGMTHSYASKQPFDSTLMESETFGEDLLGEDVGW